MVAASFVEASAVHAGAHVGAGTVPLLHESAMQSPPPLNALQARALGIRRG